MGFMHCPAPTDTATKTVDPGLDHSAARAASSRRALPAASTPQMDCRPAHDHRAAANQTGQKPAGHSAHRA